MRVLFSYGLAAFFVIVAAVWLGTGVLVQGGQGPGKGERPLVALVEPNGGPLTSAISDAHVNTHEEQEGHVDPFKTIAQREEDTSGQSAPAVSVRTVTYTVQPMALEVPVRGQTKAKAKVAVVPETQGILREIAVQKGQTVKTGDLICTLDRGTREAAVAQAQAALDQAQSQFESNAALRKKGIAAANTGLQLESALRAAQAGLENAQAELARTEVKSPVDGTVQDPIASVGTMLAGGTPCASIVQLDPMLFTGAVPEARMGLAKLGLTAKITTATGATAEGKVTFIASTADAATRSFSVEVEMPNSDRKLLDGVSASAIVNLGTMPAHLLPQSVLTLDDEGTLGVRAVGADSKVEFFPVTILSDTREGVWVQGLPPKVDVITVGQEFVTAGQVVQATNVTGQPEQTTPAEGTPS